MSDSNKSAKQIKDEVEKDYPRQYLKELYEAIIDAECKREWFKTSDAHKEIGKDNCKKRIEELKSQLDNVNAKVNFIIRYYKIEK